jgi:hypothetical protein
MAQTKIDLPMVKIRERKETISGPTVAMAGVITK